MGWKTPEGTTRIVARLKDPVWVVPESVREEHAEDGDMLPAVVPAGPDNPLGEYEFRLSWPSYLIHGTNKPYGVGMRVESRLHAPLPGGHRGLLRFDSGRHQGDGGQSALRIRLARRHGLFPGVRRHGG